MLESRYDEEKKSGHILESTMGRNDDEVFRFRLSRHERLRFALSSQQSPKSKLQRIPSVTKVSIRKFHLCRRENRKIPEGDTSEPTSESSISLA